MTQCPLDRRALVLELALGVDNRDDVVRPLDECLEPALAAPLLCQVPPDTDQSGRLAVLVGQASCSELVGNPVAVGRAHVRLDGGGLPGECPLDGVGDCPALVPGEQIRPAHLGEFGVAVPRDRRHLLVPPAETTVPVEDVEQVLERVERLLDEPPFRFQFLLALSLLGHISRRPGDVLDGPVEFDRCDSGLPVCRSAVEVDLFLVCERSALLDTLLVSGLHIRAVRAEHLPWPLPLYLFGRHPGCALVGGVHPLDIERLADIDEEQRVLCVLEQRLRALEVPLALLSLGNIVYRPPESRDLSALLDGRDGHVEGALVAVDSLQAQGVRYLFARLDGPVECLPGFGSVLRMVHRYRLLQRELPVLWETDQTTGAVGQPGRFFPQVDLPPAGVTGELRETHQLLLSVGPLCVPPGLYRVPYPVCEQFVLPGPRPLLEVVSHVGGDCVTCHPL